ncbi:MAG: hypothetical protein Q9191_001976 [Dirinaria sp. TL-2023a]
MLTPARTAAHDVLNFGQVYRSCYASAAIISLTSVANALKARRYFSECLSLQARKRNHRSPSADESIFSNLHFRPRAKVEYRKKVTDEDFRELVCQKLENFAKTAEIPHAGKFALEVREAFQTPHGPKAQKWEKVLESFHNAFVENGRPGLESRIRYTVFGEVANREFTPATLQSQTDLADLRYPVEWFPGTRTVQRTIHLHVGPTNSGKTYRALQRLEQAESGIYAGPLRLLAHEVYTRLNAKGKPCHLITGDDKRYSEEENAMVSCTVEMVPTNKVVDVGIIDEIQMVGNDDRGWAWTQALLGLRAKELHLCGEARTVPLIREIAAQMGEKIVLHHYERLSPLQAAPRSLHGNLKHLHKGDCLVVFSRKEIHAFKTEIEKKTGKRVAIVYGSLPPETRASQARLFNDPDNDYDYLVASDAIGMGLNLDIKRIIFESTWKFDGRQYEPITIPHLKQIAGRAGRYRVAPQSKIPTQPYENVGDGVPDDSSKTSIAPTGESAGLVTSLEQMDYARVHQAMQTEAEPVMSAVIMPPADVLMRFAAYYPPGTPFSYILARLNEISSVHPRYRLCQLREQIAIADIIESVQGLTVRDRIIFCASPASVKRGNFDHVVVAFAKCVANNTSGALLDIPQLNLDILDRETSVNVTNREYLAELEQLHKGLILYLWLGYRFVGVFKDQDMALYVKNIVEEKINEVLAHASHASHANRRKKLKTLRELNMLKELGILVSDKEEKHKSEPALKDEQPLPIPEHESSLEEIVPEHNRQEAIASQGGMASVDMYK